MTIKEELFAPVDALCQVAACQAFTTGLMWSADRPGAAGASAHAAIMMEASDEDRFPTSKCEAGEAASVVSRAVQIMPSEGRSLLRRWTEAHRKAAAQGFPAERAEERNAGRKGFQYAGRIRVRPVCPLA
ncbi:hypothetical protein KBP30_01065 [Streptomyces sp. Go40/10]|uniref:hypothetical protein n=1 Tax=Streptomyces sp. Go40/10 TaxID=2825844 RepID=UPI001E4D655B|nr:hypothetical protein [Streptomyces sp. Go40/10]UFQ99896.1 hypothetical protein KBP30_01065 [Streptomyces sp. Go40/10]